jgi:hypothetical protein
MKYVEEYDEELDMTFEIPELDSDGYSDIDDFVINNQAEIQAAVLSALYNAIELELDRVPVFVVKGADSVVSLAREDFKEKLDLCLEYFTQIEEYEICVTLARLNKKL